MSNTDFLGKQYLDQVNDLRKKPDSTITFCDLTNIKEFTERETSMIADGRGADFRDLAFVGRSNVGKSSLINAILSTESVQTSKTPGKTKDLGFIPLMKPSCRLVDCPGYGYAKASHAEKEKWRKFMQIYLMSSSSLQRVLLLVDLSVGLQDSDKLLMDTLTSST